MRLIYPPWRPQCKRFFRRAAGGSPILEKLRAQGKNSKLQTPSSKHQRSSKLQVPSSKRGQRFGVWNLGFLWCLNLGFWCFDSGTSLELGHWCWVFRQEVAEKPKHTPRCGPAKFDCRNAPDCRICFDARNLEQNTIVNAAPRPPNEAERLRALRAYDVLDTPAEVA